MSKWERFYKLTEIFNSDAVQYSGSGVANDKPIKTDEQPWNGREFSAEITLPPLSVIVFKITDK